MKRRKKRYKVLCPVCGEYGFLSRRWVKSSYYPMYCSYDILFGLGFGKTVRGSRYRGEPQSQYDTTGYTQEQEKMDRYRDRKSLYRITYRKHVHNYIGHYSSEKYREQMQDYKMHKRKSRPNGRKWCYLQSDSYLYPNDPSRRDFYLDSLPNGCLIAWCDVDKHRKRTSRW